MKCLEDWFEVLHVSVGQILPEISLKTFITDFWKNVNFCDFSSVNIQKLTFLEKTVLKVFNDFSGNIGPIETCNTSN